ncbi:Transcription accessory protein (S1 RNA-binding domain) [hydrothermal vent metagenome]|uniref:Transcription accessory protein (S1 RNA-binding domain) n=1 Tax=hydrothermal vent metagenome TaxID=652676 RepID=A0A3B0Z5B0_9ZZZZ
MLNIALKLSQELEAKENYVQATIELLDTGATVPFIARYRKELTGGLDDIQLRQLEERLSYLRELEDRKLVVLKSIKEQNKLTPKLEKEIESAESKNLLEDIYRPYMQKRRTKAQIAKEAGIEPLALALLENQNQNPSQEAKNFINAKKEFADEEAVLEGAKQILMELFSDDADINGKLREYVWDEGLLQSKMVKDQEQEGAKFSDYFDSAEALVKVPSHRALAMLRGRNEGVLTLNIVLKEMGQEELVAIGLSKVCVQQLIQHFSIQSDQQASEFLLSAVGLSWRAKLATRINVELKLRLRENAEAEAIDVFSRNLKAVLMAAPAGAKVTMGVDPGFRSGVKIAVVDNTGKFIDDTVIYPHQPQKQYEQAIASLVKLIKQYNVDLISIGNGTASRETDRLIVDLMKKHSDIKAKHIVVSEAGASVYSASKVAAQEFPNLDVTVRGAISIARRLQDPLAELVKIDPKAIGVGQYQHDLNQIKLAKSLNTRVEDCVNAVGVDINMASAALLSRVSGLNATLANNIVEYRDEHGQFNDRKQLKKVARLGEKTYEQCVGFLRIVDGKNPLDASGVHPESYPLVEQILEKNNTTIKNIIGNGAKIKTLNPKDYVSESFGEPTIIDILAELEKPGRDPRPEFTSATFKEGVEKITDLVPDMRLEGVITNVTNFGAFVDIGVHQDGLVHISALSDSFVKDPHTVVKTGDLVQVKVMEVDVSRNRISLTMRLTDKAEDAEKPMAKSGGARNKNSGRQKQTAKKEKPVINNAFADAFAKARK